MTPVSYYAPDEISSPRFAFSFARGCGGAMSASDTLLTGRVGWSDKVVHDPPVALFGTPSRWPVLRAAQAAGLTWYYGDHGYFGRGHYFRVTRNAYQHDGSGDAKPDRFRIFGRHVDPWRRSGSHVLVCPNSAIYCRLHGFDVEAWIQTVLTTLRQHTDREIRVRWKKSPGRITEALEDCWAVVVYSSAVALDALIAGVPAFVLAPFAAGARMGLSDLTQIERPFYPDNREPFLWKLAEQQWTLGEIFKGDAWRALQAEEARRAA